MNPELESMLDRADELLGDLEDEYGKCLQAQDVTGRAKNLTHEVLEKLRNALDHTMRQAWGKYLAPTLLEGNREHTLVYFPIAKDLHSFRSTLGRANRGKVDKVDKSLYNFLLKKQPFSSKENRWLELLAQIAAEGKHIVFTPQKRTETRRITVSRPGGGSVSWNPSSVEFNEGVQILSAPIDPKTQRITPTPGVTEQVEIWVSFIFNGYGVNALGFCKEACQKTRTLIEEMNNVLP